MTNTRWLPKVLCWMFGILSIITGAVAILVIVVMVIDPKIPFGSHLGPVEVNISGQPGTISVWNSNFVLQALHGKVVLSVSDAHNFIELLKHYGLPLVILNMVFFTVLFDLLRRMFRNVGRGESFTQRTLRLVQFIGASLLVFSLVEAAAEGWFQFAVLNYLSQHAVLVISGTAVHLPPMHEFTMSDGGSFPFGTPIFFTGLLVLALSEVFRQGLVLKSENDLTV